MTVIEPSEPYISDPEKLLALAIWREARGEPFVAKLGVMWTILNRTKTPGQGFGTTISAVILHPGAFSSFLQGDPNSTKYPAQDDPSWNDSLKAAASVDISDPTDGAVFYFSPPLIAPPHVWGNVRHSATIGNLEFYKISPTVAT